MTRKSKGGSEQLANPPPNLVWKTVRNCNFFVLNYTRHLEFFSTVRQFPWVEDAPGSVRRVRNGIFAETLLEATVVPAEQWPFLLLLETTVKLASVVCIPFVQRLTDHSNFAPFDFFSFAIFILRFVSTVKIRLYKFVLFGISFFFVTNR